MDLRGGHHNVPYTTDFTQNIHLLFTDFKVSFILNILSKIHNCLILFHGSRWLPPYQLTQIPHWHSRLFKTQSHQMVHILGAHSPMKIFLPCQPDLTRTFLIYLSSLSIQAALSQISNICLIWPLTYLIFQTHPTETAQYVVKSHRNGNPKDLGSNRILMPPFANDMPSVNHFKIAYTWISLPVTQDYHFCRASLQIR